MSAIRIWWVCSSLFFLLLMSSGLPACGDDGCEDVYARVKCGDEAIAEQQMCAHLCQAVSSTCYELCVGPDYDDCSEVCTEEFNECNSGCTSASEAATAECDAVYG